MSNIAINSGTGPGVAVDPVGLDNYQIVKIMQAGSGATASLATALVISGSVNVIGTPAVTMGGTVTVTAAGLVAISGTVSVPFVTTTASIGVIGTAHASRFQAYALATTSAAAGVIIKTSGAHTLYITDITIATPTAVNVQLCSETTPLGQVFLAANGGWAQDFVQPLKCASAESVRVILSSSGTCAVTVIGYTVT